MLLIYVGEVVSWVDGSEHFLAMRTEEAIASFAAFGRRAIGAEGGDGDGHGQVVAVVTFIIISTIHATKPVNPLGLSLLGPRELSTNTAINTARSTNPLPSLSHHPEQATFSNLDQSNAKTPDSQPGVVRKPCCKSCLDQVRQAPRIERASRLSLRRVERDGCRWNILADYDLQQVVLAEL